MVLTGLATAAVSMASAVPAAAAPARRFNAGNWDQTAQRLVVREGLMSNTAAGFAGAQRLSGAELSQSLQELATRDGLPAQAASSGATVSVVRFDALLVGQLGLGEKSAEHVEQVAQAAGLEPPSYFGSEVVARYLELRYEHPVGEQSLDLYPWNPITRAEAAYSLAQVLGGSAGRRGRSNRRPGNADALHATPLRRRPAHGAADRGLEDRHAIRVGRHHRRHRRRARTRRL